MCLIHFYKRDKDTSSSCQGCLLRATLGLDILNRPAINLRIQIILNSLRTVIILSSLLIATILKCLSSMHQEHLPRIHHKLEQLEVLPPTHHNYLENGECEGDDLTPDNCDGWEGEPLIAPTCDGCEGDAL